MTLFPNYVLLLVQFLNPNPLPNSLVTVNENDEINKITFEGRRTVVLVN